MKKIVLFICVTFLISIGVFAQVPTTSTSGNEVWYYIKCSARQADPNAMWLTGADAGGQLTVTAFNPTNDYLRWKVVENGIGLALVNKATGVYMNTDITWSGELMTSIINTVATAPNTPIKLVPSVDLKNGVWILENNTEINATGRVADPATMVFCFYATGSGTNFKPISYNQVNIHSSVVFMTDKDRLKDVIASATTTLNSSSVGTKPGQFIQGDYDALQGSIKAGQEVYDDPNATIEECANAVVDINLIQSAYKSSIITPKSDLDKWYLIQSPNPANTYMTSQGLDAMVTSSPLTPNDDNQLWGLVKNTNGPTNGFALVNKATGQYLNADAGDVVQLNTQTNMPTNNLTCVVSPENTNNVARFWIKNTEGSASEFLVHAGDGSKIWNWVGGVSDRSTWLFVESNEAKYVEFNSLVENTKKITSDVYQVGSGEGQFSAEMWNAFVVALDAAKAMLARETGDNPPTEAEIAQMTADLNAAIDNLKNSRNLPITFSTEGNEIYYYVEDRRPVTNYWYVGDQDTYVSRFLISRTLEKDNPAYMFKFVKAEGTENSFYIYCKANPTIALSVGTGENLIQLDATGTNAVWSITNTFDKEPAYSNVKYDTNNELTASYHNAMFVGFWTPGYEDFGNDWKFVRTTTSGIKQVSAFDLGISVVNRKIVSTHPDTKFTVYSVLGQRVNQKSELPNGVYIVQVDGKQGVAKVLLR